MAVTSSRTTQISQLAGAMPAANEQVARGLQASQRAGLGAQVVQATRQGKTPGQLALQQAAASSQQAQGQVALQAQQQTAAQMANLAQTQMQEDALQKQQLLFQRQQELSKQQQSFSQQLAAFDANLSQKLWQEQMQFEEDEMGRKQWTERQLLDWQLLKTNNIEELEKYEQFATQVSQFELQALEGAYATIMEEIQRQQQLDDLLKDQALEMELVQAKARIEKEMAAAKARDKERAMMWSVGGQIVGTAVGVAVGVAATVSTGGAAAPVVLAAASAGGGLGSAAGSFIGSKQKSATEGVNTSVSPVGNYGAGQYK